MAAIKDSFNARKNAVEAGAQLAIQDGVVKLKALLAVRAEAGRLRPYAVSEKALPVLSIDGHRAFLRSVMRWPASLHV